jgi:hypothetical protein
MNAIIKQPGQLCVRDGKYWTICRNSKKEQLAVVCKTCLFLKNVDPVKAEIKCKGEAA